MQAALLLTVRRAPSPLGPRAHRRLSVEIAFPVRGSQRRCRRCRRQGRCLTCTVYICKRRTANFTIPSRDRDRRPRPACGSRIRPCQRGDPERPALPIHWSIAARREHMIFLTVMDFGEGDWTIPTGLVPVGEGFGDYHSGLHSAPPPGLPRRSEGWTGADPSPQTAFHRDKPGWANGDFVRAG